MHVSESLHGAVEHSLSSNLLICIEVEDEVGLFEFKRIEVNGSIHATSSMVCQCGEVVPVTDHDSALASRADVVRGVENSSQVEQEAHCGITVVVHISRTEAESVTGSMQSLCRNTFRHELRHKSRRYCRLSCAIEAF